MKRIDLKFVIQRSAVISSAILAIASTVIILNTYQIFDYSRKQIYAPKAEVPYYDYAIVFGAGVSSQGRAEQPLYDRLSIASKLYHEEKVGSIVISGDNSSSHNYETDVMKNYLVTEFDVDAVKIVVDEYGLRTYDTCARAAEVYEIEQALLITQGFHLPRAIYTCEKLGIDVEGYSATIHNYDRGLYYEFREFFAISRAWFDLHIHNPTYITN